jgi:hypothetical protein
MAWINRFRDRKVDEAARRFLRRGTAPHDNCGEAPRPESGGDFIHLGHHSHNAQTNA